MNPVAAAVAMRSFDEWFDRMVLRMKMMFENDDHCSHAHSANYAFVSISLYFDREGRGLVLRIQSSSIVRR